MNDRRGLRCGLLLGNAISVASSCGGRALDPADKPILEARGGRLDYEHEHGRYAAALDLLNARLDEMHTRYDDWRYDASADGSRYRLSRGSHRLHGFGQQASILVRDGWVTALGRKQSQAKQRAARG